MSFSSKKLKTNEKLGCACYKGGLHKKAGTPNQDACLAQKTKYGIVLAVADGVGSQKYSQIGSKSVVKAVDQAFSLWEKGLIPVSDITKTIFKKYCQGIPESKRRLASTTCVFAYLSNSGELFLGQSGDGICFFRINERFDQLQKKEEEFANIVSALNASRESPKWRTRHFIITPNDTVSILLATDGISNDIIPGHEEECLTYYCDKIKTKNQKIANFMLLRELKSWDPPNSGDDKTMVVYRRG